MPKSPKRHRPLNRPPATRPGASVKGGRGYDHRWQQFRAAYLIDNPLCVDCQKEGRAEPAVVVDHVIPHRGDAKAFWAGPFQGLCVRHHNEKTARGE